MRQDAGAARHIWYSLGRYGWCATAFLLYFCFTCYQLGLPGLHYDEAREAGVNAMEILTGAPASLFRDVGLPLFGYRWPLMVQDYIGALNVYLALPFLWLTGIGVPNLRILPILIGACTLILVERTISEWDLLWTQDAQLDKKPHAQTVNAQTPFVRSHAATVPLSRPGLLAIKLLVASPSFVFWSRQGIFVTNITQPLVFAALWHGIRWLRLGRGRALMTAAFWAGCALYAKLLAIWILGPFAILVSGWWLWRFRSQQRPRLTLRLCSVSLIAFLVPLLPLVWFNLESAGTLQALTANVGTSYYGVDNLAIWHNLPIRLAQLQRVLAGNHFWYLGGLYGNPLAEWGGILLLGGVVLLSLRKSRRGYSLAPGLLLLLAFIASLFTISDLFQTHYTVTSTGNQCDHDGVDQSFFTGANCALANIGYCGGLPMVAA
ncbi:MAG: hypothetical protein R2932_08950 [Caldilineaceae bacterium]